MAITPSKVTPTTWSPSSASVAQARGVEDGPGAERVAQYARARDFYLRSQIAAKEPQSPGESLELLFKSIEQSRDFRTAYVQAIQLAVAAKDRDPATSRGILERLVSLVPNDPSAKQALRELFP